MRVAREACPTILSPRSSPTLPGNRADEAFALGDYETGDTDDVAHSDASSELSRLVGRIAELQARLYAEESRGVLVVLQGIDAAGKDSTVKHVFSGSDPQGVRVFTYTGAQRRRGRARLPLALPRRRSRPRHDPRLQPLARRGRASSST